MAAKAAIYVLNQTPTWTAARENHSESEIKEIAALSEDPSSSRPPKYVWTTPFERLYRYKPNITNIRVFGCHAYVRHPKINQSQKSNARAWIGYLVGYQASNIWLTWNPRQHEVVAERDVEFDEDLFYDPDLPLPEDIPIDLPQPLVEILTVPQAIQAADAQPITPKLTVPITDPEDEGEEPRQAPIQSEMPDPPESLQTVPHAPIASSQPVIMLEQTPLPESPKVPGAFNSSQPATPEKESPVELNMDGFMLPSPEDFASQESIEHPSAGEPPTIGNEDAASHQLLGELPSENSSQDIEEEMPVEPPPAP